MIGGDGHRAPGQVTCRHGHQGGDLAVGVDDVDLEVEGQGAQPGDQAAALSQTLRQGGCFLPVAGLAVTQQGQRAVVASPKSSTSIPAAA